jgi:type IV secretion system protein VirD4
MIVLGTDPKTGDLVVAADEDACLGLGAPRSGKTSGLLGPSVLAHRGPCIVTSSKHDVITATLEVRQSTAPAWSFGFTLPGTLPIRLATATWNPIPSCLNWDTALLHASALVGAIRRESSGTDQFWYRQSERLLAGLLHAAALTRQSMVQAALWANTGELEEPISVLRDHQAGWAMSIVESVHTADERYRDSVLNTASDVLRVFDLTAARANASGPGFPVEEFLDKHGTLYIVAPSEHHGLLAPLVVGLISEVVRAQFLRANQGTASGTLLLALDELARIAPLHTLPGWLAEAGSHHVQILGILQDLSQARDRWGTNTANGFLTLFRHKMLLPGVMDKDTLEAFSYLLGEQPWATAPGSMTPRPRWTPNELAAPPAGTGVHIDGAHAQLINMIRLHDTNTHPKGNPR